MRTGITYLFLLAALIIGVGLMLADRVSAQTFRVLHSFHGGVDGGLSEASLILSDKSLYGMATYGGSSDIGSVFKVNSDGTGFTNLLTFTGIGDGANPSGGLILSGNTLYGTTAHGGSSGAGTVFAVNIDGTGFTNLHSFTYSDGAFPWAGLILSSSTLYGTVANGGGFGNGMVFAVKTKSAGFGKLGF